MIVQQAALKVVRLSHKGELNRKLWYKLKLPEGWRRHSQIWWRNKSEDGKVWTREIHTDVKLTCRDEKHFSAMTPELLEEYDLKLSLLCR